jgi:hypothetical protein
MEPGSAAYDEAADAYHRALDPEGCELRPVQQGRARGLAAAAYLPPAAQGVRQHASDAGLSRSRT